MSHHYTVDHAENGLEALEYLNQNHYDVLISDIVMPGLDGISLTRKAVAIHKNLKVIVIGEYSQLSDKDTKEDNSLLATGTFEFWKLLKDSFEEVENIENLHKFNYIGYFGYDSTTFYKPKKILSTLELKERYENLLNKFYKLKERYIELNEKYKLTDTYTQSESFIPKENNYLDDKEYKNLKCYFEDLKYHYRKIKLNNI
jgi:CheY-like chemotaxis protein